MKKKHIIIVVSIVFILLTIFTSVLIYKNVQEKKRKQEQQKTEARYKKVFSSAYKVTLDNSNEKKLETKNNDEKIIYEYFDYIVTEKINLSGLTYEQFLVDNPIVKIYENPSEYLKKIDEYNTIFASRKENLYSINKNNFINYLKDNGCSEKGITILNKQITENNIKVNSEVINSIESVNKEKSQIVSDYVSYLNTNKNNWYLKDNKIICKTNEVLKNITDKNKEFGITITTEKEKPKVVGKQIPVIMYHGVSDTTWGLEGLFMKVNDFENQMKYLYDNGYETIFIEDIEKDYTGKKVVALTFDDGYIDFYTNVLPIIKKYNIKTNLYIITNTTSGGNYVNEEQIKELSNSGLVSIGSHTVSHNPLASLNAEQIETELKNSKEYLENLLGKEIKTISYPTGSYNSTVLNTAEKYYKYGITTIKGTQNMSSFNKYKIIRRAMYRGSGMGTFKNIVSSSN